MSIVKSFNINGLDSSISLASENENGLMSSVNYNELSVLNQTVIQYQNDEYGYAISDILGTLLFGIKWDGTTYIPKGIPDDVQTKLDEVGNLHLMQNDNYCFAITDTSDNLMFGVSWSGSIVVNSIIGLCGMSQFDTKEFIYAVVDSYDRFIFGVRLDGTFVASKWELPEEVSELIGTITKDKNPEFSWRVQDKNGRILMGAYWDGTTYIPKGIPEEVKPFIEKANKRLVDLEKQLENFVGGTGDWSDYSSLEISLPRCAMVNISGITSMPTSKANNYHAYFEMWDMQGNYFKKKAILNAQGTSSMGYVKKNFAADFCNDNWVGDDTFSLKIGDWVPQDSFHFKAYYTDFFRGVCPCCYKLYEQIVRTRGNRKDRPWKKALIDMDSIGTTSNSFNNPYQDEYDLEFDTGARCFPDGFPCIVYLNSEFYGIFSWQIKKHRDNYHMDKDTAEHVHIDGTLYTQYLWAGTVNWTQFEIRNPKNLYTTTGTEYDGDSPVEIAGETEVNTWIASGVLPDGTEITSKIKKRLQNTAKVKTYIQNFANYVPTLQTLKSAYDSSQTTENLSALKTVFETYFDIDNMVDYMIMSDVVKNSDGFGKNWQWFTYDGIKWYVGLYDVDMSFGGYWEGNQITAPLTAHINTSTSVPSGYCINYYTSELEARYKELSAAGIIDADNIFSIVKEWTMWIGVDNYEAEYEKWPDSPCIGESAVNTTYWELVKDADGNPVTGTSNTYNASTNYAVDDTCYYGLNSTMGYYQFKCISDCTGVAPVHTFRHTDNIYRIQKWIEQEVSNMDSIYNYTRE